MKPLLCWMQLREGSSVVLDESRAAGRQIGRRAAKQAPARVGGSQGRFKLQQTTQRQRPRRPNMTTDHDRASAGLVEGKPCSRARS